MPTDEINMAFAALKGLKLKKASAGEAASTAKDTEKRGRAKALKPGKTFGRKPGQGKAPAGRAVKSGRTPDEAQAVSGGDLALDETLFTQAMTGVNRLDALAVGRQVHTGANAAPPQAKDPDAEARSVLADLVSGKVEFDLEYSDEYVQGIVKGADHKIFRQLKAGRFSPEAHLDLHGLNADQAQQLLLTFAREQYFQGKRCVLVIPGRGINSPGGNPVLKEELKIWLTRDPLKRVVLAFCTAQPRHGGTGALYVLMRQKKKTEGKIRWDNWWGNA